MKFRTKVDVVESMGSELYAYFDIETNQEVQSDELADLAKDAGLEDVPSGGAQHVVARLDAASRASAGGEVELVLNTARAQAVRPRRRPQPHRPLPANGAGARAASSS